MDPADDGGVTAEVLARHGRSHQPESQQIVAVLQALTDVIRAENLPLTPTSLFAAAMSALEKQETITSTQVTLAMCNLLGFVLPRVPNTILRTKFNGCAHIVCGILERHHDQAPVAKAALLCLSYVLSALDPTNWPAAQGPCAVLLAFLTDSRPKVRKRAVTSLTEVMAALQNTPALAPASELILQLGQRILSGPEAAARAAAAASNKQRPAAETAITKAVADALHLLGALKQVLPLMAGIAVTPLCDLLLRLLRLRQPLLTRHTTEVLTALVSSRAAHLSPQALSELLKVVLEQEGEVERRDAEAVLALTRLVEGGLLRLHDLDATLATSHLPGAFHVLVPQLAAEQDGVRFGTSQALRNLIHDCIDDRAVAAAAAALGRPTGAAPPLVSVVAAVTGALGARYQDAWPLALPVAGELVERLGRPGAPLLGGLLGVLGALCAGAADKADDSAIGEAAPYAPAAEAALGAALRALGPQAVVEVLPLNLKEGITGSAEARTWLLPLLRRHVRHTQLAFWAQHLMPLARDLGAKAVHETQHGSRQLGTSCLTLELQLWHTLPAFASWPTDTAESYKALAEQLGAAFTRREDLRAPICLTLQRLCLQNRKVLKDAGETVGFADPVGVSGDPDDEDHPGHAQDQEEEEEAAHAEVPVHYNAAVARANLVALRALARNWLGLLCKMFLETAPEARAPIGGAIAAYCAVADAQVVAAFFRTAIQKVLKLMTDAAAPEPPADAILDGGADPVSRRCSFLDLSLCMAAGLDDAGLVTLYRAAKPAVHAKEAALQKKGYKILAYLAGHRKSFALAHLAELLNDLITGVGSSVSAAKRFRLRCLQPAILLLTENECPEEVDLGTGGDKDMADAGPEDRKRQVIASMVGEVILCVKEANTKTRTAAYELLVGTARAMHEAQPPPMDMEGDEEGAALVGSRGGLHTLFTMVLGGLVGSHPHMISASVMALARLMYEFAPQLESLAPDLLPPVLSLLRTKSREVVKAVLGFVKVLAMRMPVEDLSAQLGALLEGLLLWSEDTKNRFRLKVRVIVERLARRCGYDAVAEKIPASDSKLLTHIRKANSRKERKRAGSENGGQDGDGDGEGGDVRSVGSGRTRHTMARTARASEWGHSKIFDDDEGDDDDDEGAGHAGDGARSGGLGAGGRGGRGVAGRGGRGARGAGGQLRDSAGDPMDLLDPATSRHLVRSAAGVGSKRPLEVDDFSRDDGGRMVIEDEEGQPRKRKRGDAADMDSDDSDMDDLRGIAGVRGALRASARSVQFAPRSVAGQSTGGRSRGGAMSVGGRSGGGRGGGAVSVGGRSSGGRGGGAMRGRGAGMRGGRANSGDRYKARGTGGDAKGSSKHDPFAYWSFDRKMLNRRTAKRRDASGSLGHVVDGAKKGVLRGNKAKRAAAKRQRPQPERE